MDIWILVIGLLVLSIIFYLFSLMASGSQNNTKLEEQVKEQEAEIRELRAKITELEPQVRYTSQPMTSNIDTTTVETANAQVEIDEYVKLTPEQDAPQSNDNNVEPEFSKDAWLSISDRDREEIIRYYSQGYTLNEIAREVEEDPRAIHQVIEDYIENR